MDPLEAWSRELLEPTRGFFDAYAARVREADGALGAVRDAVRLLLPKVDWPGCLPQVPHGLLGLGAALRLMPRLEEEAFLALLGAQLRAFAGEPRSARGEGLEALPPGSGHRPNWRMAVQTGRPAIAWGEALALPDAGPDDFHEVALLAAPDMANVGHKAVVALRLQELAERLGPSETPRLLALASWLAASQPRDFAWHARVQRRLEGAPREAGAGLLQALCEGGQLEALDACCAHLRLGREEELRGALLEAAAARLLDARADLEGRTVWLLVYAEAAFRLPAFALALAGALVNFFPSVDPEERLAPHSGAGAEDPAVALREALLDGEPGVAMAEATRLLEASGPEEVCAVLAAAAAAGDPGLDHAAHLLGASALPRLLPAAGRAAPRLLEAFAKHLANSPVGEEGVALARRAMRG